jgi:uncharacterized protein YyaL (SSP411 family)
MFLRPACLFAVLLTLATQSLAGDEPKAKEQPKAKPNRLAKESSPYLLQHAYNPVDWYPWGQDAFERAKKEKKLIFLSIGYSSCHWCHVMERESFENAEVAKILNENFVCIKVDREERPDIDDIYMTALTSAMESSGGWPLTMFLTSDGKPIVGGTYFPPEDKKVGEETAPGLKSILIRLAAHDKKEHDSLVTQADQFAKLTAEAIERSSRVIALVKLDRDLVDGVTDAFDIDPLHGGTGSKARLFKGTKFPRPPVWEFLLSQSKQKGKEELAAKIQLTLHKMAEGGIYDHIGGGFHRYSTERTWTVPHFEKMLYDNAQLVELYSNAYALTPDATHKRVVAETLAFVKRDMTSPEGGFYSALDADSNHKEGEFYVWTADEIKRILGDADAAFFMAVYGTTTPNFEGKFHILRLPKPLVEIAKEQKLTEVELLTKLAPLKRKLFDVRVKREPPFLDTKIIVAWNGEMIAGFARAGQVFKNNDYIKAATTAADFILTKMRDKDGRLFRMYAAPPGEKPSAKGTAFLDDYANLVHGLLNLHDATGEKKWLDAAQQLTDIAIKFHGDGERGGYFFTPSDGEKLFARSKDSYDGVQPSGNSQTARNLLRLWAKTKEAKYRELCEKTMKQFTFTLRTSPTSMPTMALCLNEFLAANTAGNPGGEKVDPPKNPKESLEVVKAELKMPPPADGRRSFTVTLSVTAPWHVYANPVGQEMLAEAQTEVVVYVGGKKVEAAIEYPKGKELTDTDGSKYSVYEGDVKISGSFPVGNGEAEVRVKLTACKEGKCLLRSTLKLK